MAKEERSFNLRDVMESTKKINAEKFEKVDPRAKEKKAEVVKKPDQLLRELGWEPLKENKYSNKEEIVYRKGNVSFLIRKDKGTIEFYQKSSVIFDFKLLEALAEYLRK